MDESIEAESVQLSLPRSALPEFPSPTGHPIGGLSTPARERDVARFFHGVHRQYFAQMKTALIGLGLKAPITAVTDWDDPADLLSITDELDFVGCNWYYDHPVFSASREWRVPSFYENRNSVADDRGLDFAPSALRAAVDGKPIVLREWGACWPSKFRGVGLLEGAAYAALQDIDAMIMFTYDTRPDRRRIEYFDVSSDPVRWGVAGIAGEIYRSGAVSPATKHVAFAASRADALAARRRSPAAASLTRLGWTSQVRQHVFDQTADVERDLVVATGQLPLAYPGERVLFPGSPSLAALQMSGYGLIPRDAFAASHVFDGFAYDAGQQAELAEGLRFEVADLEAAGLQPIGLSEDGALAGGFRDPRRENCGLLEMGHGGMLRAALDLLGSGNHAFVDRREYLSDTGEIRRNVAAERLTIDAPRVQAFAGAFSGTMEASGLRVTTPSALGVIAAISLDEKPISENGPTLIKMVTVAANEGEKKGTRDAPPQYPQFQLDDFGDAPVHTHGKPSDTPTSVMLAGRDAIEVQMVNGTWEAARHDGGWTVWCDTPGVKLSLPELGERVAVTTYGAAGEGETTQSAQPFTYPAGCRFARVVAAPQQ
ncbi:MAG TPA: hypothetical protein QGH10_15505 [Armatimonadota bacterium]|nr:hypothetical protein [Armatimonadota bacterium]